MFEPLSFPPDREREPLPGYLSLNCSVVLDRRAVKGIPSNLGPRARVAFEPGRVVRIAAECLWPPSRVAAVNRCTGVVDNQPMTTASDTPARAWVRFVPTLILLLAFGILSTTSAQEPEVAAEQAARSWLLLLDGEQYFATWNSAATLFKNQLSPVQWQQSASAARSPFGALRSRRLRSATYATTLPGAPDGQYVVLQFDSVFDHKASAVETVTPMLDDGVWRVGGYFIR